MPRWQRCAPRSSRRHSACSASPSTTGWTIPTAAAPTSTPRSRSTRLAALLDDVRPDTVLTFGPDGFTGHPDHRTVSAWTDLAVRARRGHTRGCSTRWRRSGRRSRARRGVRRLRAGPPARLRRRGARVPAPPDRARPWTGRSRRCCARCRRPAGWSRRSGRERFGGLGGDGELRGAGDPGRGRITPGGRGSTTPAGCAGAPFDLGVRHGCGAGHRCLALVGTSKAGEHLTRSQS